MCLTLKIANTQYFPPKATVEKCSPDEDSDSRSDGQKVLRFLVLLQMHEGARVCVHTVAKYSFAQTSDTCF